MALFYNDVQLRITDIDGLLAVHAQQRSKAVLFLQVYDMLCAAGLTQSDPVLGNAFPCGEGV